MAKRKENSNQRLKSNYSPNKLRKALLSIENGSMTVSQASTQFDIPRTTLIYKSTGKRPKGIVKPGPESMLGKEIEKSIVEWIQEASKKGFPITKDGLCFTAKKLLDEGYGKVTKTFKPEKGPGRRWFQSFFQRNPNVTLRQPEYLHRGRAAVTEERIRKWFTEVSDDMGEQIEVLKDPKRIFNCDETAFFLHPKSRPVLAIKGQKNVYDASTQSNKENVTVLITGNACGDIAPPLALFSFERIPSSITVTANRSWGIGRTPSGWMTSESFYEYVTNVLNPYFDQYVTKPVVLFLDGHASHLSLQLGEFCKKNQIILVALPPNATHMMQPLDVGFFGPLKKQWTSELERYKLENKTEPRKHHVLPILDQILRRPNFKLNLIKGFEVCGLFPFEPNKVDYTKCISLEPLTAASAVVDENDRDQALIKLIEERIPVSMKKEFDKVGLNEKWTGNEQLSSLFYFYKSVKFNLDFQALIKKELPPLRAPNHESMILDISVPVISDLNDLNLTCGISYFDLPDEIVFEDHISESSTPLVSSNSTVTAHNPAPEISTSSTSPRSAIMSLNLMPETSILISPTLVSSHLAETVQNPMRELSILLSPISSPLAKTIRNPTEVILTFPIPPSSTSTSSQDSNSEPLATTSQDSLPPSTLNSIESSTKTTTTSDKSSASSKKSVDEILSSVIRFSGPEVKGVKTRKKLHLPAVMTCRRWLDLKKATEDEKQEIEKRKQERIADRKIRQEQLRLKVTNKVSSGRLASKRSKKQPTKRTTKKTKNDKSTSSIENPVPCTMRKTKKNNRNTVVLGVHNGMNEVEIGQWVVVQFEVPNSRSKFRRYIAQIIKVKNGYFFGDFLRPVVTREFSGFVYSYPTVRDMSKFRYSQITQILQSPKDHGRGKKIFNIHIKNL